MAKTTLNISARQLETVEHLMRAGSTPQAMARRCSVVVLASRGLRSPAIAEKLGIEQQQVRRWRNRWEKAYPRLTRIEQELAQLEDSQPSARKLQEARAGWVDEIGKVLWDAPRPGAVPKFTTDDWCAIIQVASEPPEDSGRPITHWTARELRDEVMKRGIVKEISVRHLARFFGGVGVPAPQGGGVGDVS